MTLNASHELRPQTYQGLAGASTQVRELALSKIKNRYVYYRPMRSCFAAQSFFLTFEVILPPLQASAVQTQHITLPSNPNSAETPLNMDAMRTDEAELED